MTTNTTAGEAEGAQEEPIEAYDFSLIRRVVRPIYNWRQWIDLWKKAETIEEMKGLLHIGFLIPLHRKQYYNDREFNKVDRLEVYLKIADGWYYRNSHINLETEEERFKRISYQSHYEEDRRVRSYDSGWWRRFLAKKAFYVLCQYYFAPLLEKKNRDFEDRKRSWFEMITTKKEMDLLQAFFVPIFDRSNGHYTVANLGDTTLCDSSQQKLVADLFFELAVAVFDWERFSYFQLKHESDEVCKFSALAVNKLKPWLIKILDAFQQLDRIRPWLHTLDNQSIAVLEEIALSCELSRYNFPGLIGENRKVESLEEAMLAGSSAARLLLDHRIVMAERDRLKKIHDAKRAIVENQRILEDAALWPK